MGIESLIKGKVARELPTSDIDGARDGEPLRIAQYGEAVVMPLASKGLVAADEGSHFIATNPTPGTGIATIAALASLVDTSPFILIRNDNPVATVKTRIYLDYLKLVCTAVGTAGTAVRYAIKTDSAGNRYTSGGSMITPVCTNRDSDRSSMAQIYAGALVAAAATSGRLLGHGLFRSAIPVINDSYMLNFGGSDPAPTALVNNGATLTNANAVHPPVVIGPGQWCAIHIWLPSQSAASSWEFELSYVER